MREGQIWMFYERPADALSGQIFMILGGRDNVDGRYFKILMDGSVWEVSERSLATHAKRIDSDGEGK